jgi:hypothetical protein
MESGTAGELPGWHYRIVGVTAARERVRNAVADAPVDHFGTDRVDVPRASMPRVNGRPA